MSTTPWATLNGSGSGGVPGAGDTVTITNNVTMTSDNTIGDGTSNTCVTCPAGTLTITGAKLTVRGSMLISGNSGAVILDLLMINPNGSTQGGIEFNCNSG